MVQRLQYLCHKRAVPALDFYYEALIGTLWPRSVDKTADLIIILFIYFPQVRDDRADEHSERP